MNKEYRTRLETLLSFFKYASANKNIKTIKVEGTGFLDDAEIIIGLIEKELSCKYERPKGKWNGWGHCSICGYSRRQGLRPEATNYCSNCGADMRKSEVEDGESNYSR